MFRVNSGNSRSPRTTDGIASGLGILIQRLFPALARRKTAGRLLEHLESLPLTAQSSLALIRLREETLLLGITPHNITLLAKNPEVLNHGRGGEGSTAAQERTQR